MTQANSSKLIQTFSVLDNHGWHARSRYGDVRTEFTTVSLGGLFHLAVNQSISVWVAAGTNTSVSVSEQSGFSCTLLDTDAAFIARLPSDVFIDVPGWSEVVNWTEYGPLSQVDQSAFDTITGRYTAGHTG
eukprot:COSAG05_NODE_12801_length_454_cov_0.633803_1_plen_130_part_10